MSRGPRQRRGRGGQGFGFRGAHDASSARDHKRLLLLGDDGPSAFTLTDEARTTAHGATAWSKDSRLRSRPITFVSAGCVDPLKQLEDQLQRRALEALGHILRASPGDNEAHKSETADDPQADVGSIVEDGDMAVDDQEVDMHGSERGVTEQSSCSPRGTEDTTGQSSIRRQTSPCGGPVEAPERTIPREPGSPLFFFDTTRDESRDNKVTRMERQSFAANAPLGVGAGQSSNAPDTDSSEEDVILFKGRRHHGRTALAAKSTTGAFDLDALQTEIRVVGGVSGSPGRGPLNRLPPVSTRTQKKREKNEIKRNKKNRKSRSAKGKDAHMHVASTNDDEEEAIVADYIANMRQQMIEEESSSDESLQDMVRAELPTAPDPSNTGNDGAKHSSDTDSGAADSPRCTDDLSITEASVVTARGLGEDAACHLESDLTIVDTNLQQSTVVKPSRRSKAQLPSFLHLSDSDLESQLIMSFESGRLKKAEKRKERERLRAQGVLGSKVREDDTRTKYPTGMKLEQVADELRSFLNSNQASLTLPPMDNHVRKVIHELANKFNIKSKSTGSGDQRRPTLYRTLRTLKYSEEFFDSTIARVGRKYFPRRDRTAAKGDRPSNGHGGNTDLSYRDGEIVGGSAPELGEGNKGRWMLEKMGWSSGTALGTTSNKGILQPVEQKVKRGKAGLG